MGVAYITSVGVQQVSITIASGQASGTATITAVGALAFITSGGSSTTATSSPTNSNAIITLTNSTTVTATRTGTSATTVTVNCSVVDATANLITSVQFGTVTLTAAQASNTAAISSVNANSAVLHFLGSTTGDGTIVPTTQNPYLSYSGTTVTATVSTAVTSTMVVQFCMIEFNPLALNSNVQVFSTSWSNASVSTTQTTTSVNANTSCLFYGGSGTTNLTTMTTSRQRGTQTSGTVVTISVSATGSDTNVYNFTLVEFAFGVINTAADRAAIALTGVTTNTLTIGAIDPTKCLLAYTGGTTNNGTAADRGYARLDITNSTTITATKSNSTGNATVAGTLIEFAYNSTYDGSCLMGLV